MKRVVNVGMILVVILITLMIMSNICNAVNISSQEYQIDDDIISYVMPKTSIEAFRNNIRAYGNSSISSITIKKGTQEITTGNITTGMSAIISVSSGNGILADTYVLSVSGDVTGDGKADALDLTRIIRYIIGKTDVITGEAYLKAANVNNNDKIDVGDLTRIIKYIVTTKTEYIENPNKTEIRENVGDITVSDYGKYVDLGTEILDKTKQLNDGTTPKSDWRIFNKDDNGVWLILSDYMPASKIPSGTGLYTSNDDKFIAYSNSSRKNLITGLNSTRWKELISSNNELYNNSNVSVKGAIDLENWVNSWNDKEYTHINIAKTTSAMSDNLYGNYVYKDGGNSTSTLITLREESGLNDTLYFPRSSILDDWCYGYWTVSPSAKDDTKNMFIFTDELGYANYDANFAGIRPVVFIPSNTAVDASEEVWKIGEKDNTVYETYSVGEEVKIGDEFFYVIEDSEDDKSTVNLIAKYNLTSDGSKQSTSNDMIAGNKFSSTYYWKNAYNAYNNWSQKRLDISSVTGESSGDAIYKAKQYATVKGGANGRLLTYEEVENLTTEMPSDSNNWRWILKNIKYQPILEGTFYLGSAVEPQYSLHEGSVWMCYRSSSIMTSWLRDNGELVEYDKAGVRPVLTIDKSKVVKIQ